MKGRRRKEEREEWKRREKERGDRKWMRSEMGIKYERETLEQQQQLVREFG